MPLRFKYPKITYDDLVASMGLTETPIMNPPAPGPQWPNQAFITMGNRCKGDAISPSYLNTLHTLHDTSPGSGILTPGSQGDWMVNNWWARPMPWLAIIPGANNRCTNAAFVVFDTQIQLFSKSLSKWVLASNAVTRSRQWTTSYYQFDYITLDTAADLIWKLKANYPAYNCVKQLADRTAEDTNPPTTSKYRIVHSGLSGLTDSVAFDVQDIGGVFITAAVRMISSDGAALNSSHVEFMAAVAGDYYPDFSTGSGSGHLVNPSYVPAIGSSCLQLIPSDGSTKRLYFISADINPNTYIEPNSAYAQANGVAALTMSADTLRSNVPQLMTF